LLRAINTPGRTVKMDRVRTAFESVGLDDVSTFLASGNVIFDATDPLDAPAIEAALESLAGFPIPIYVRTTEELIAVADGRPFGEEGGDYEVSFLPAEPDAAAVAELVATATGSDRLAVVAREVYWMHSGPRRESAHSEETVMKILGMPTTQRSIRTIRRIADKYLR
jgi:uncharacterized protein (DUF1697 family)